MVLISLERIVIQVGGVFQQIYLICLGPRANSIDGCVPAVPTSSGLALGLNAVDGEESAPVALLNIG